MLAALQTHLTRHGSGSSPATGTALASLVHAELDQLPLPGEGATWLRWQLLAAVGAHDLSLLKLFEGHTDALAILAELGSVWPSGLTWGVWCAEPPQARVDSSPPDAQGLTHISGRKAWCSGAATVSHALVSTWNDQGESCLVAVALDQAGVTITNQGWQAVGMAGAASVDVLFNRASGIQVGPPGAYLSRPGFWQGGAGVASGWYGAALALGELVRAACQDKAGRSDPHQLAHLGQIDIALQACRALLHQVATWIDHHPTTNARTQALRARLVAENCATQVMKHAGRALGAGPWCQHEHSARLMADLPVFLRQSHAERDLAALGLDLLDAKPSPWLL